MGWNPRLFAALWPRRVSKPHGGALGGGGAVRHEGLRVCRRRPRLAVTLLSPLLLLLGCGGTGPIAPESAEPVIVAILTAGADEHRLRAAWSISPDALLPGSPPPEGVPIMPSELSLQVDGPGGGAPVAPVVDSTGTYRIRLPVVSDAEYRLIGTIRGRPISATVRVPGQITLIQPTNDTVALTEPGLGFVAVPYHVRSRGAAAVALITNPEFLPISVGDTTGVWHLSPGVFPRGYHPVTVEVYEAGMAEFLFREDWTSNIAGAVGVFGARAHHILTVRVP